MNIVIALGAIAGCFLCMRLFQVVGIAGQALVHSREAVGVLRSVELSDEIKEATARRLSITFLGLFASITLRTLAAVLVPAVLLFLLDAGGVIPLGKVAAALESWTVILLSLAFIPFLMVRRP